MFEPMGQTNRRRRQIHLCVAIVSICVVAYLFTVAVIKTVTGAITLEQIPFVSMYSMPAAILVLMACIFRSVFVVSRMPAWKSSDKCAWALLLLFCSLIAVPVFSIWSAATGERMPVRLPFFTVLGLMVVYAVVSLMAIAPVLAK